MDHIEMAQQIADAACHLDGIKDLLPVTADRLTRNESIKHIAALHHIAEQLSGARAHEIYGAADITKTA